MEKKKTDAAKKVEIEDYVLYPVDEDIYNKSKEEENINPEDILKLKEPNESDKAEQAN